MEIIVVLVLIGLATGLIMSYDFKAKDTVRLQSTTNRLKRYVGYVRQQAILHREAIRISVDTTTKKLSNDVDNQTIKLELLPQTRGGKNLVSWMVFPTGGCEPQPVLLKAGTKKWCVQVESRKCEIVREVCDE